MPDTEIDPKDTIDRAAEQELFAKLVSFTTPARMLVISDKRDRGKSTLLNRLRYNCKYEISPLIPVGLVDLKELSDSSPFAFIEELIDSLNIPERFSKYFKLNKARVAKDFSPFDTENDKQPTSIGGSGAVISGDVVVNGNFAGRDYIVNPPPPADFTSGQENIARKRCIEAFVDDLRVFCAKERIVILIDHWEQGNYDLREWIRTTFVSEYCFNSDINLRPDKLAIVIAGDTYDIAEQKFGIREDEFSQVFKGDVKEFNEIILSRRSLSDWESGHVRDFLSQNGFKNFSEQDIDIFRDVLKTGRTLRQILQTAEILAKPA